MQWKAFSILVRVLLNRKIIASYKDMFPNLLDTRKGSKKRGFDKVSLANACALWLYPTLVPLGVKFIAKSNLHISVESSLAVEASIGAKGKYPPGRCFTGKESDFGVFMSIPSLSSSAKDLVYVRYFGKSSSSFFMLTPGFEGIMLFFHPDFASIVLCFLKVSEELPAVEPFPLIFRSSIVVLVVLGFALLSRFGKDKLCNFYVHGII
ncbi:hypothetical protein V6N13_048733 [Hibiscus sabdariffa]